MSVSQGYGVLDITGRISDASITKYRIVCGDTTDTTNSLMVFLAATAETTKPLGVALETTTAADASCTIRLLGTSFVEMNGDTIDIGDSICATTGGKGAIASTPDDAEQWAIGYALAPSTSDGEKIQVLISPHLIVKGTA